MAVLAISAIGSMIGNAAIAGTVMGMSGAAIGWSVGSLAASMLLGPGDSVTQGPRLTDLKVSDSSYGGNVPRVYGTVRIAGNVIWATERRETKHKQRQGGKGGPKQTLETFTYDMGIAIAFAFGPGDIRRIWINKELAFDASATTIEGVAASNQGINGWRFYRGDEDQEPDPDIVAWENAHPPEGQPPRPVSAFRGIIYMVNGSLQLADYGNNPPSIEAEIVADSVSPQNSPRVLKVDDVNLSAMGGLVYGQLPFNTYSGAFHSGTVVKEDITYFLITTNDGGGNAIITDVTQDGFSVQSIDTDTGITGPGYSMANTLEFTFNFNGELVDSFKKDANLYADSIPTVISSQPQYLYSDGPSPWIGSVYNGIGSVSGARVYYSPDAPDIIGVAGLPMRADYSQGRGLSYTSAQSINVGGVGVNGVDNGGFQEALIQFGQQGRRLVAVAMASDDSCMIAFTCAAGENYADEWVKLNVAGGVTYGVDQGTCDPADMIAGHFGVSQFRSRGSVSIEEDGRTMWRASPEISRNRVIVEAFQINETTKAFERIYYDETLATGFFGNAQPSIMAKNGLVVAYSGSTGFAVCARTPLIEKQSASLAEIVRDQCRRSGLTESQIDVSQLEGDEVPGFTLASAMTARAAIEPLRAVYFFDMVESANRLKFVKRGQPVLIDIPEEDLAAHDGQPSELPDAISRTRAQSQEVPQEVSVTYPSIDSDYQAGSQYARRLAVRSSVINKIDLPICMSDDKAAQVAAVNLYVAWQQVETFSWSTTRKYEWIDPTDVVRLRKGDDEPWVVRVTKRSEGANGIIQWEGVEEDAAVYTQQVIGGRSPRPQAGISLPGPTDLKVIDTPTLRDSDGDAPMALLAASPQAGSTGWRGASLFQSTDDGQTYSDAGISFNSASAIGIAQTVLQAPPSFGSMDIFNTVQVSCSQELSSIPHEQLLRYGNVCMIGGELLAFGRAELIAPGTYRLSNLLRGLKGTEDKALSHELAEPFVLIETASNRLLQLPASEIGQTILYKAPTFGQELENAKTKPLAFTGRNMIPLSPVFTNAFKNTAGGDWTLSCVRRTRKGGDWRNGVDAELGEASELFDFELYNMPNFPSWDSATLKRTISNVPQESVVYTAAMQTEDWGGPVNRVGFKVYQRSAVIGRGVPALCARQWSAPAYNGGFLSPFSGNLGMKLGGMLGSIGPGVAPSAFSALLHFDGVSGASGNDVLIDSSGNNVSFTYGGSLVSLTRNGKKFGPTCLLMNGAYLSYIGTKLDAGLGDYCYEGWFNLDNLYSDIGLFETNPPGRPAISDNRIAVGVGSGGLLYAWFNGAVNSHPTPFTTSVWNYVTLQRKAGVITLYLNGVGQVLTTGSAHNMNAGGFMIGSITENPGDRKIFGKIDDFVARVGIAPYGSSFIPPLAPSGENTPGYDYLLKMDGSSGSTDFVDSGFLGAIVTSSGSVYQNGAASAVFNGGRVTTDNADLINLPNTDLCMQGIFKTTLATPFMAIISKMNAGFVSGSWFVGINESSNDGKLIIYWQAYNGASAFLKSTGPALNDGVEHHWAWTRKGSKHTLWIDGVASAIMNVGTNFNTSSEPIIIGNDSAYPGRDFIGEMRGVGITLGSCFYDEPFTPPTSL